MYGVAVAGHCRDDVGEADPSGADREVQVGRPRGVLAEPRCIGRTGQFVGAIVRISVADPPDVLVQEQLSERVRRVPVRPVVGVMEAVPVDAVAALLAVDPPGELRLAMVAGQPGQYERCGDEEIDGVAVDDVGAHRRTDVRVTRRTMR